MQVFNKLAYFKYLVRSIPGGTNQTTEENFSERGCSEGDDAVWWKVEPVGLIHTRSHCKLETTSLSISR